MSPVTDVVDVNQDLRDLIAAAREAVDAVVLSCSLDEVGERLCLAQELRAVADAVVVSVAMAGEDHLVGPSAIRRDIRIGSWLRDFVEFEDAFNAGTLTRAHVAKLREVDNARTHWRRRR